MAHPAMAVISIPVQTPDVPVSSLVAATPAPAHTVAETIAVPAVLSAVVAAIPVADVLSVEEVAVEAAAVVVPAAAKAAQVDAGINAEILTPPNRKS